MTADARRWMAGELPAPLIDARAARRMALMDDDVRALRERADRLIRRACRYRLTKVRLRGPEIDVYACSAGEGHGAEPVLLEHLVVWLEDDGFSTELVIRERDHGVAGRPLKWRCALVIRW